MTRALQALERELVSEFERDPKGRGVARILGDYARANADWRPWALFEPGGYTRNLVARNEWFELLILCWSAGGESPIHNHAGQNCWMAVLDGEIEEIQFEMPARAACELRETGRKTFVPGKVAYINDDIALHRVRPAHGAAGVSLHLYSRPIETCLLYDERTGEVATRVMGYHSVRGEKVLRASSAGG